MPLWVCQICLSILDESDERFNWDTTSEKTVWSKLTYLGFFQAHAEFEISCHICSWCARRVDDAFTLKIQCLNSKFATQQGCVQNTSSFTKDPIAGNASELGFFADDCGILNPSFGYNPESSESPSSTLPVMCSSSMLLTSARSMFGCMQTLSDNLEFYLSLLASAVRFTENIVALLHVLATLKEEVPSLKKSAESIRDQAVMWRLKTNMLRDSADFVSKVSSSDEISDTTCVSLEDWCKPKEFPTPQVSNPNVLAAEEGCELQSHQKSVVVGESLHDFASAIGDLQVLPRVNNMNQSASTSYEELAQSEDVRFVRRSRRPRSVNDHLVNWPKFRKQRNSNRKHQTPKLSSPNVSSKPDDSSNEGNSSFTKEMVSELEKCTQIDSNDSSLLQKLPVTKTVDSTSKLQGEDLPACKLRIKFDAGTGSYTLMEEKNATSQESTSCQNGDVSKEKKDLNKDAVKRISGKKKAKELNTPKNGKGCDYVCPVCCKVLASSRKLKSHARLHMDVSLPQCRFCAKHFSSDWNRVQHERVHTGEKPYVCDLCNEAFRYNVTLRTHKAKSHV